MEDDSKCFGKLFEITGAKTLKLRLWSSVAVLGTTRFHRMETGPAREIRSRYMQTCWKYAGSVPQIQINARNAILNIR